MLKRSEEVIWLGRIPLHSQTQLSFVCGHLPRSLQPLGDTAYRTCRRKCLAAVRLPAASKLSFLSATELSFVAGHLAAQVRTTFSSLSAIQCDHKTKFWWLLCDLKDVWDLQEVSFRKKSV